MKRKLFFIGTLLWSLTSLFGQECGTTFTGTPSIYPLNNKSTQAKGSSSAICINVFFHIVRNTNGTNAFTLPDTDAIVANLNLSYSPHNIVINNLGTNFINNTSFVNIHKGEHTTLMNSGYDLSNAINYYIVEELWDVFDSTGTYRGFVAGVADNIPSNSLVIRSDRVFAETSPHELGHCLNLLHTHSTSNGIENIKGFNCSTAGDLVCDTPADPELNSTNVDSGCNYFGGGGYNPLTDNIMSYSPFGCREHFTEWQGFRMRYAINFEPVLQGIRSTSCTTIEELTTICYLQTTTVVLSNTGGASATWSSSSNVQIVSSTNTNATIKASSSYANGDGWVQVVLSNGITFQENFHVGKAEIDEVEFRNTSAGTNYYFCSSHYNNEFEILPPVPDASYEIRVRSLSTYNIVAGPFTFTGNIATLPTNYNYTPGWYLFEVRGTNNCGITNWTYWEVEFVDCTLGGGGGEMEFSIYPNPSTENFSITRLETAEEKGVFKSTLNEKEITSYFELYDFNNNLVKKGFLRSQLNIDVSSYKKGRYILKIVGRKEETHYLILK